jgi:hypothetical protein
MKRQWRPPSKKTRKKNLSPRKMKACHSIIIALIQSVTKIGTQSTNMKSIKADDRIIKGSYKTKCV